MKFLVTKTHAINLSSVAEISVSCNYLLLTIKGEGREVRFVYGAESELTKLFYAIMQFASDGETIFNCDKFLGR